MNDFDAWIRKRAAANPKLYGPELASEGKEIVEVAGVVVEPTKESNVVRPNPLVEPPRSVSGQVENKEFVDWRKEVADHDDGEIVDELFESDGGGVTDQ